MRSRGANEFDVRTLFAAMDAERVRRGLSWPQVARALWEQSHLLNERRQDHPISPSTLTGIAKRGDCTCQHALFILRWLARAPESFIPGEAADHRAALLAAGDDRRLRWNLKAVFAALNERRRERDFTWRALARELGCTEHQLTGIRTARYAIGMNLMMKIVRWLDRPSSDFIHAAQW